MNPVLLSQNDPQWRDLTVGTSKQTIGQIGCVITCIGMKYGLTPDKVNELLNSVKDGFVETNLVNWTKLPFALPGSEFVYKYSFYDNEIVKQNLPCIVEVDAKPIGGTKHWVLYVGNHILYDPFDGQAKSTDTYQPLSFVVLRGQYSQALPTPTPATVKTSNGTIQLNSHGIDITNQASVQEVFDTWWKVANGEYVSKVKYDTDLANKESVEGEDPNYTILKQKGYTTIDDVDKALKAKDDTNLALQKEIAETRLRNAQLAKMVTDIENEDHTTHELGLKALTENKELRSNLDQIAKELGVDGKQKSIMNGIFQIADQARAYIRKIEEEQRNRKSQEKPQEVVKSSEVKNINWLLNIFNLNPISEEVKQS